MEAAEPTKRRWLNRDLIVEAALRITESEGTAALTLRRLAAELGTGQASLYRHITDRDQLLRLVADELADAIPIDTRGGPPRTRVLRQWRAAHAYLDQHRWVARAITGGQLVTPRADDFADHALADLRAAGLGPADSARAYRALWNLVFGHVLNAHPIGHPERSAGPGHPNLRRAQTTLKRAGDDFDWALRKLVTGILGR